MFVSLLPFSLSEKSRAMCWWLWTSSSTCPWRTCASSAAPSSTRRDMLWPYSSTTGRMATLDSGNLAWGTSRVSEAWKCRGLVARKKNELVEYFPSALSHLLSAGDWGTTRAWQFCVLSGVYWYIILFLVHKSTSLHNDQRLPMRVMVRAYLKQNQLLIEYVNFFLCVDTMSMLVSLWSLIIGRVASDAGYFLPSYLSCSIPCASVSLVYLILELPFLSKNSVLHIVRKVLIFWAKNVSKVHSFMFYEILGWIMLWGRSTIHFLFLSIQSQWFGRLKLAKYQWTVT